MVAGARFLLFCVAFVVAAPAAMFAQTSSVAVTTPGVMPVVPLTILDSDYPFASLIANDEGQTVLNLILSDSGNVRVTQIVSSSGVPALDGAALTIARTRWSFRPPAEGAPTATEVGVTVSWKLPLTPRDEYAVDLPGPPANSVVTPPDPKPGSVAPANLARPTDYPAASLRLREQGETILKVFIDERGIVSNAEILESSGYARLDQAAATTARRYLYEPATINGMPTALTFTVHLGFFLRSSPSDPRPLFCHSRPYFSTNDRYTPTRGDRPVLPAMWLLTEDGSQIHDALLLTKKGWQQLATTALTQLKLPTGYRVAIKPPDQSPCWVRFVAS
jgi:TonB family protein